MFNRKKSVPEISPDQQQPEDYDNRCVKIDGIEDMSVEELTKEIINLYGKIPPSQTPNSDVD